MSSTPSASTYPGNPSLPREVREKILSTFRHTLNLYHQGKIDDCLIGCDFILKMDPRFAPARKLMDKAKNPAADVNVAELEALVTATPTRQERVAAIDPDRLLVRAVESYNARDFDAAITAAEQVLAALPGNRDALQIVEKAKGKKASQPLFETSRQRALAALEENRYEDARQELGQMRGLDPDHPAVALLERRLDKTPAAPPPPVASAPAPPEDFHFDLSSPEPLSFEGLGGETREPQIRFDDVSAGKSSSSKAAVSSPVSAAVGSDPGLESLSLDSLSLDSPPAETPRPPRQDLDSTNPGAVPGLPPPAPPPGSPADFWTGSQEGESADLEEFKPEPPPAVPPSVPLSAPPRPAPAPVVSAAPPEEEETPASDQEIAALLHQGDEAARRGDRQQAIEVWSRIFLIDINNAEAVSRIEKARQEMAEGNRTIADCLKNGRQKFEAGDYAAARELFLKVLAVDENEPTARFYIDQIEDHLNRDRAASPPAAAAPEPRPSSLSSAAVSPKPAPPAPRPPARRLSVPPRVLALVGVAALAIAAGVYFVFKTPRTNPAPPRPASSSAAGSLARAKELAASGKTDEARKELSLIPRSSPDYAAAHRMLAELSNPAPSTGPAPSAGSPQTAAASGPAPVAAPGPNDPATLRAAGEKALAEKRYIEALKNFNLAAPAFRNDPTFAQSMGVVSDKVAVLAPSVKLYNEGEYETAIPVLWRIYQEDRENQDARSYLLRCYFNQGVTQLQNGTFEKAVQSFDEALALDPNDAEILRHRKFAQHYSKGDLDLMGRIYVRHLNRRP